MPFTPTHILAVIPIFYLSRVLPLSALAVGAIIPDFPMFFPISTYNFSHSLLGIVLFCIPVAMIFYILFEKLGKIFALDVSPKWVRYRLPHYYETRPIIRAKNIIILCVAFAIGSATHIVWDAFTHQWGWGVELFPALRDGMSIFGIFLPYYKLIQYGSTIIGLPLLFVLCVIPIYRSNPQSHSAKNHFSTQGIVMIALSFIMVPFLVAFYHWQNGVVNVGALLGYTIKHSIGVCITLFFTYSLIHWWRNYRTLQV